jgi:hypothetical protein
MKPRTLLCSCLAAAIALQALYAANVHFAPPAAPAPPHVVGSAAPPAPRAASVLAAFFTPAIKSPTAPSKPSNAAALVAAANAVAQQLASSRAANASASANYASALDAARGHALGEGSCLVLGFASEGAWALAQNWAAYLEAVNTPFLLGALDQATLDAARAAGLPTFAYLQARRRWDAHRCHARAHTRCFAADTSFPGRICVVCLRARRTAWTARPGTAPPPGRRSRARAWPRCTRWSAPATML